MSEQPASQLERLLQVQTHDTHLDQLLHTRAHLPEKVSLTEAQAARAALAAEMAEVESARDALARDQKREEDQVASFEERIRKADQQLYGGTVTNPRELQALHDDIAAMKRHCSDHEDRVLALMEQIEPLQSQLDEMRQRLVPIEEAVAAAAEALGAAEAALDAELAEVEAARREAARGIAPQLLDEYTKLRRHFGGVAVARLVGNRCEGCHLTLSAVEVDRLRHLPVGELAHCEECGRMLVVG